MLANYSYFQSYIIQLPSFATLDSVDPLANYTSHTMGSLARTSTMPGSVNRHHENVSLPQSFFRSPKPYY